MNWETIPLINLARIRTGKLNSNASVKNGLYPFFTCSQEIFRTNTFSFHTEAVLLGGNNASGNYPIFYFKGHFDAYQRTYIIEPFNSQQLNTRFLYYLLELRLSYFKSISIGAATKFITLKILNATNLHVPPITVQQKIIQILSAYDDLIENNLKRIKLLLQVVQNIYKEWFVNLRFPGHEQTSINPKTRLPEGWEIKGLCEFNSFKQYKTKIKPFEGTKEYLATASVNGLQISDRGDFFNFENKPSRAQVSPPINSVWFARMSKTDKVLFFTEKSNINLIISSGFAGFKTVKKEFLPFLFCIISSEIFSKSKDNFATGSTQISINNHSIKNILFVEPKVDLIHKFGEKTYSNLELIDHLLETNQRLKTARDILLPRLMNQTIKV